MRELHDHKVNPVNDKLRVMAVDEPGSGGAHHNYEIGPQDSPALFCNIYFQNGPINEAGVNGVTQEALLTVVLDRLRSFQKGPFASRENDCAITNIEQGLHWPQQRTIERMRRGVEGTHQK